MTVKFSNSVYCFIIAIAGCDGSRKLSLKVEGKCEVGNGHFVEADRHFVEEICPGKRPR